MRPQQFDNFPDALLEHPLYLQAKWRFPAVAQNVVDGDTGDYMFDKGMHDYPWHRIRHEYYDAPEEGHGTADEKKRGKEAEDFLRNEVFQFKMFAPLAAGVNMSQVVDTEYGVYENGAVAIVTQPDETEFHPTLERWAGLIIVMWEGKATLLSDIMKEAGHVKQPGDTQWNKE